MATKVSVQNVFRAFLNYAINSIPTQTGISVTSAAPGSVGQRPFTNKTGVIKVRLKLQVFHFKLLEFSASFCPSQLVALGGLIAHKGASYLEENEIFVPTDEDDDD
ncbi:hypothetical protein GCK72_025607 [Caenorhabditis remanei]|uniref:Essential MCU regulator, mitochondrial n=1 Tax=Caenorhabditis remanei TaxID=31234 RepID=A0A6A5G2F6_CAERE|nr:hypothetical protein GCK72_025607 [Caenorhabditis remanei]KAF1749140.1 hypothetical protein GCK72_025607 [Caenorhabditis remanei]